MTTHTGFTPDEMEQLAAERTLPHNLEAERSVLGAVLVHNEAFEVAVNILHDDDFYRDAHRRIWLAIKQLVGAGTVADFVTVKEQLSKTQNGLDECGGPAYIAGLADGVPRSTNIKYYAEIVHEKAMLRGIITTANSMMTAAYMAEDLPLDIITAADKRLLDIQNAHVSGRMKTLHDGVRGLFAQLEYRSEHRGELTGLDTGFKSINELTLGWQPGDLVIIAARPSMGKTTFVMNTAVAAARSGKHVAMFSLEMRKRELEGRLLSSLSGVDFTRIRSGYLSSMDWAPIAHALEDMSQLPISIDDRAGQGVWEIRSACRRLRAEKKLDLVIVDYVQLMSNPITDRKGVNRSEQIGEISRRLKVLADEVSCPILLLSQLSRAASQRVDKRPQLSDLRESGSLEQDSDIVAFLHRAHHVDNGTTEFIVEKQRNGPTGILHLTIKRETLTFLDGAAPETSAPKAPEPTTRELYEDGE